MPKSVLPQLNGFHRPAASQAQSASMLRINARYENSLTNDENQRQWSMTDFFSAKAANNFATRRSLRVRSRYEVSNNPFLFGICCDNASDVVNTGPTLQCLRSSNDENRQIERAWNDWCAEVDYTEKLRTIKLAKTVDGEGFLILKTVKDMEHPVKLYPVDVEADQITAYMPGNLNELWIDGLTLHPVTGRPVSYTVLRSHPGDWWFPNMNPYQESKVLAKHVIHWFVKFRPGQVRGVPAFTTSLDMFTELRSFRKAVLARANTAANLSAVLENTVAPADEAGTYTASPFSSVPIDRNTMVELPHGLSLKQFSTGEPSTTYQSFQEACLGEACRPLSYPLNLALGSSQKFNFSSTQLDHKNYRNGMGVERTDCDKAASDKIFKAFIEEGILVPGLLPKSVRSVADVPHEWHWPGFLPLDAVADSTADHARLSNGTMTWQQFWASRGYDWREVMKQQADEKKEMGDLDLVFGEPLKKTDKVDETTETAGTNGKPKEGADATGRPFPIRAEWSEEDHPRGDDGRFGQAGRHASEQADLDTKHEAETDALDKRHETEKDTVETRHEGEARQQDARHQAEKSASTNHEATDEKHETEHEELTDRHSEELGALDEKHVSEKDAHESRQSKERDALDERHQDEIGEQEEHLEKKHSKESDALDGRHEKETEKLEKTHEKEKGQLEKDYEKDGEKLDKQRDKEDDKLSATRDKEDEKREAKREKEDDSLEKRQEKEEAAHEKAHDAALEPLADDDKEGIDKVNKEHHAKEKAMTDRHFEERKTTTETRAKEDADLNAARVKEDKDLEKKREDEDEELTKAQNRREDELEKRHDAERQALEDRHFAEDGELAARQEKEKQTYDHQAKKAAHATP